MSFSTCAPNQRDIGVIGCGGGFRPEGIKPLACEGVREELCLREGAVSSPRWHSACPAHREGLHGRVTVTWKKSPLLQHYHAWAAAFLAFLWEGCLPETKTFRCEVQTSRGYHWCRSSRTEEEGPCTEDAGLPLLFPLGSASNTTSNRLNFHFCSLDPESPSLLDPPQVPSWEVYRDCTHLECS